MPRQWLESDQSSGYSRARTEARVGPEASVGPVQWQESGQSRG